MNIYESDKFDFSTLFSSLSLSCAGDADEFSTRADECICNDYTLHRFERLQLPPKCPCEINALCHVLHLDYMFFHPKRFSPEAANKGEKGS